MKDKEKKIDNSWRAKMVEKGLYKDSEITSEEKQIEEMAQLIGDSCTIHKVYVNKHYPDRQKDMYYSLAEELLKRYQPKLPEDSVVLSKDDYEAMQIKIEQLTKYAENERQLREYYCNEASKETAEKYKIAMMLSIQEMQKYLEIDDEQAKLLYHHNYQVAKQFSVEIKE